MKKLLLSIYTLLLITSSFAQENYWTPILNTPNNLTGKQYIYPDKFELVYLNYLGLKNYLFTAPLHDMNGNAETSPIFINLPMPDGSLESFKIVESPIYETGLLDNFPGIKTFLAYNPNHPTWYTRLDITPKGFHAMIMGTENGTIYIDPIMHNGDINHYYAYYKKDYHRTVAEMVCELNTPIATNIAAAKSGNIIKSFGSCEMRTYRLALAATGEYTTFHGGTVADALAAQVTTMNRVNAIFERDVTVHMNIIATNSSIIYTNSGSDPYTNNSGFAMLTENQTNLDATIGTANYDIGHVFSTGGGGVAQLQSPCNASGKARGVTGSPAPINDPFDVDYVAHEMGHQFGANHTFHSQSGSCSGNRNLPTAYETGSGTTIMGYAGICNPHNVQNNSDDYFHNASLEEMGAFVTGASHTCPVTTSIANIAPTVSTSQTTLNIPVSTPFSLTAFATDPNPSNTLTYCWEQMDNQDATMPPVATATGGPSFRSFSPTTNPTRHFPNLPDLIAGTVTAWEVLPTVARTMEFRVTVRDNATVGGCNDHLDVTLNVIGTAGPFEVTAPNNTGISVPGNSNLTVTWLVASTDIAPINCGNVNILLSTDGGLNFSDTLASNVTNDGSQSVVVPNTATTQALILVQCADGSFFDISDNTFTITPVTNDFTLSSTGLTQNICPGDVATFAISVGELGTFTDNITLSVVGLPTGAVGTFTTNNQAASFNSDLNITNTAGVVAGNYSFTIEGTSTSGTKTLNATLNIQETITGPLNLSSPANNATGVSAPVDLSWFATNSGQYYIEIATDAAFATIIESSSALTDTFYNVSTLPTFTDIFWRVGAYTNCDTVLSSTFTFQTANCAIYNSSNIPISISPTGTSAITSTIDIIGSSGTINDVNIVSLSGSHTFIQDLTFTLTSPASTSVVLLNQICNNQDDFDIQLDDQAANNTYPCPPVDGNAYIPQNALSAFNGENANGTWTLTVADAYNGDGGQLDAWGIEVCYTPTSCTNINHSVSVNACDSALVEGVWLTNDTTFNSTHAGVITGGCDSIYTYTVQLSTSETSSENITECDSALIAGTWYTTSQTIQQTDTTVFGCDSIHTINLTINNSTFQYDTIIACDSAIVTGNWYYSSQTIINVFAAGAACPDYTYTELFIHNTATPTIINQTSCLPSAVGTVSNTFVTANGCDSIVITNTTLGAGNSGSATFTACDSTQVNGVTFYSDTTFNDTIIGGATNGCDTITDYTITILSSPQTSQVVNACDSFVLSGTTYTTSQLIAQTYVASNTCDSIHTIDLTITPSSQTTSTQTACDSAFVDGTWYFSSQQVTLTYATSGVCDSTHVVDLTVNNSPAVTTINTTSCIASAIGSVSDTFVLASGCDSIVVTNTTLSSGNVDTTTLIACDSITISGVSYYANTSFNDTLIGGASNGCDSITHYDITINQSMATSSNVQACDSATIDLTTYYSSQMIQQNLTTANGCDSIHTINLTINNTVVITDIQTACASFTWIDGMVYTSSNNTATYTIATIGVCDTVYNLDLTISNASSGTDNITACNSYTWIDGITYTANNTTATDTLPGSNGCDSIVTLNLTIVTTTTGTDVVTACGSHTWIDGITYSTSNNTASFTITNSTGCDSIVSLDLTITSNSFGSDLQTACDSYTWINGNTYHASNNTASHVLPGAAVNGCDSIVFLDLTLNYSEGHTYVITACDSFTWVNGVTYTASILNESYIVPGATSSGCDSLYFLDLTIIPSGSGTDVITACESYTWIDGLTYTSSTTTPTHTVLGANNNGCNALRSLDLTIVASSSISIIDTNGTLVATSGLSNYQWYRNNQLLVGETNSTLTPTLYGGYTCVTSNGICNTTSNMIVRGVTSISDLSFEYVNIYPNPVQNILNIEVSESLTTIRLIDVSGKIVEELDITQREFYMGDYARGMYFIEIANEEKRSIVKVILK